MNGQYNRLLHIQSKASIKPVPAVKNDTQILAKFLHHNFDGQNVAMDITTNNHTSVSKDDVFEIYKTFPVN